MLLAHKINRAKWDPKPTLGAEEIAADAVTADLRTTDNAISFWKCDSDSDEQIQDVVLALASTGTRVDKIDIALVNSDEVVAAGLHLEDTKGKTPVARLEDRHVDIDRLDLVRLGTVAQLVRNAIKAGAFRRLPKKAVLDLLVRGVRNNDIAMTAVNDDLRTELEAALAKGA